MTPELVVFDCDGVLVHSERLSVAVEARVRITDLATRFVGRIFSATEVARGKPAPDIFLHAAAAMGVVPQRCVVVDDSVYGVRAAVAAGMDVLGFAGGLSPQAEHAAACAETFEAMSDLVPWPATHSSSSIA
ncbi:hypothetical protein BH18ACT9_BH18ACT9_17560 [soil metagenome]